MPTNSIPFPSEPITSPTDQLREQMLAAGITPPQSFVWDGQIHRFPTKDGHDDAGWYVLFDDNIPAGAYGDWRAGINGNFVANLGRPFSAWEQQQNRMRMAEAKKRHEEEQKLRNERASENCEAIWKAASPATPEHPYLAKKGILSHFSRIVGDGSLVVPLFNPDGSLSTLQYIDTAGTKLYHKGGATKGKYATFGEIGKKVYLAEGFATAATIYEATGIATVCAYSASNLEPVAGTIRAQHPTAEIIIVADNDKAGIGRAHADQASAKHGCSIVMPPIEGMDANDYRQAGGDLVSLLSPKSEDWLVNANDFARQPSPIRWLVKRWVQADAMIMVHGPSGSGKTFIVLDWCMRMAAGYDSWVGGQVKPASVVYLAGEGHQGIRSRIKAWKDHNRYNGDLNLWISKSGCDLNTPGGLIGAIAQIRQVNRPDLIVIDTLHRFLNGDENSAQDTKTMLDACAKLQQEFGCSTLLVHHTGVNEEAQHRGRGSSAWRGALDIEISVKPPKQAGDSIEISQKKAKDSELAEPVTVRLFQVQIDGWLDEDNQPVTSAVIVTGDPYKPTKPPKDTKALQSLAAAWVNGRRLMEGHFPYLEKVQWMEYLVNSGECASHEAAKKYTSATDSTRTAARLVQSKSIVPHLSGYKIIDPELLMELIPND